MISNKSTFVLSFKRNEDVLSLNLISDISYHEKTLHSGISIHVCLLYASLAFVCPELRGGQLLVKQWKLDMATSPRSPFFRLSYFVAALPSTVFLSVLNVKGCSIQLCYLILPRGSCNPQFWK